MSRTALGRLAAVILATVTLTSCSGTSGGTSTESSGIPSEYRRLVLVGASQGGALYNWVVGASQIFNKELGMQTSVQASGTQANAYDIDNHIIKFGTTSPLDLAQISETPSSVEDSSIRTLINAMSTPFHIIVAADAGIDTLGDLDGKAIATGVTGSIESEIAATALDCAGAHHPSIQNIGKTEGAAAFGDGAIDAWTGLGSTPTAAFLEVFESRRGAKVLPLDGDVSKCVVDKYKYLTPTAIPAGTYPNQPEDVATLTQWFYAAVSKDMPDEVVQILFQTLVDHHDQFVSAVPAAADATAQNTAEFVGFPIHQGTLAALNEQGLEVTEK